MNKKRFEKLLEPSRIGIKNRIVKTATSTASAYDMGGFVNKRHVSMYEALARGGASQKGRLRRGGGKLRYGSPGK